MCRMSLPLPRKVKQGSFYQSPMSKTRTAVPGRRSVREKSKEAAEVGAKLETVSSKTRFSMTGALCVKGNEGDLFASL
ncbi:MAG: hypothetical protein NTNFB02_36290 [Nitrospira sp.]